MFTIVFWVTDKIGSWIHLWNTMQHFWPHIDKLQLQKTIFGNFKTNAGKLLCLEFSGYSTVLNSNQAWFTVNWQFPRCVVKVCCENVTGSKNWIGHFLVSACSIPSIFSLYFLQYFLYIFFVFPSIFTLHFLFLTCSSISSAFDTNNSLFSDKVSPGNPGLERTLENGSNFTSNIV